MEDSLYQLSRIQTVLDLLLPRTSLESSTLEVVMEQLHQTLDNKELIGEIINQVKGKLPVGYNISPEYRIWPHKEENERIPDGYNLELYLLHIGRPSFITATNEEEMKPVTEELNSLAPKYGFKSIVFSITPAPKRTESVQHHVH